MRTDTVTLGVDAGGPEADRVMRPIYMPLRKLLAKLCVGPYSPEIDEFAFVLRIDGNVCSWNFESCDALKLNRRERSITIDIGVPKSRWENTGRFAIAQYLLDCVVQGLQLMIKKLQLSHIQVDAEAIASDLERVKVAYLDNIAIKQ